MKRLLISAAVAFCLSGCAGYRIGDVKPHYLADIHTIAIPTFRNQTFLPRIEVLLTNTVIKQLQQDGTFRIGSIGNADATLKASVQNITRAPTRFLRGNVLATTEFNLNVNVLWTLVDRSGRVIAGPALVTGTTNFFVGSDVTTDERQALPLATEDLAVRLASQLSEGW